MNAYLLFLTVLVFLFNFATPFVQRHPTSYTMTMQSKHHLDADAVYTKARIDYSAVNNYIKAHYNISQYFDHDDCIETIYDGRRKQEACRSERAMLKETGLAIVESLIPTCQMDWSESGSVQQHYLPELERVIKELFAEKIIHISFWNPMMRGESLEISRERNRKHTPTANIASLVHIDTDVGAYENIDQLIAIIKNNRMQYKSMLSSSSLDDLADIITRKRKRFAILNFWRNIGEAPVTRAPLSIYSPRYDGNAAFPNATPSAEKSKWYMYPLASKDEVIVFYQYDRERSQPSDLFHCAVEEEGKILDHEHRRTSFDIRAFIVFDEEVSPPSDRFTADRTRPMLSLEESGCFCDEQAAKRNIEY